jgi:hypothetical protein
MVSDSQPFFLTANHDHLTDCGHRSALLHTPVTSFEAGNDSHTTRFGLILRGGCAKLPSAVTPMHRVPSVRFTVAKSTSLKRSQFKKLTYCRKSLCGLKLRAGDGTRTRGIWLGNVVNSTQILALSGLPISAFPKSSRV